MSRSIVVHPNPWSYWLHSMRLRFCNPSIVTRLRGPGILHKYITLQYTFRDRCHSACAVFRGRSHNVLHSTRDEGQSWSFARLPGNLSMDISRDIYVHSTISRFPYLRAATPKQTTTIELGRRCRHHEKQRVFSRTSGGPHLHISQRWRLHVDQAQLRFRRCSRFA